MIEGCISGSIHFVMMVNEDEGQDRRTCAAYLAIDFDSQTMSHTSVERQWIHGKVNNKLIERIILNVKNGGKQASSYTVNLCRKEITLAQHAKVFQR